MRPHFPPAPTDGSLCLPDDTSPVLLPVWHGPKQREASTSPRPHPARYDTQDVDMAGPGIRLQLPRQALAEARAKRRSRPAHDPVRRADHLPRADIEDQRPPVGTKRHTVPVDPGAPVRQHRQHQRRQPRREPRPRGNRAVDVLGRARRQPAGRRRGPRHGVDQDRHARAGVHDGGAERGLHVLGRGGRGVHGDGPDVPGGVLGRRHAQGVAQLGGRGGEAVVVAREDDDAEALAREGLGDAQADAAAAAGDEGVCRLRAAAPVALEGFSRCGEVEEEEVECALGEVEDGEDADQGEDVQRLELVVGVGGGGSEPGRHARQEGKLGDFHAELESLLGIRPKSSGVLIRS